MYIRTADCLSCESNHAGGFQEESSSLKIAWKYSHDYKRNFPWFDLVQETKNPFNVFSNVLFGGIHFSD